MPEVKVKKRFFKKEKKELKPKRHKALAVRKTATVSESKFAGRAKEEFKFPNLKFPNIYRIITELFQHVPLKLGIGAHTKKQFLVARNFWLAVLLVICLGFAAILSMRLWYTYHLWQEKNVAYLKEKQELSTWDAIIKQYPTYRDAYFEAAVLAYRLGQREKEFDYLQKALAIDPNFSPAQQLRNLSK